MTDLFFTVLRMSGYGLVAAVVVMVAMLLLSRTRVSKTALLLLWLIVGVRLVCPWSPTSPLSLFNWDLVERGSKLFDRLEGSYVGDAQVGVQFADGNSPAFDKAVAAGARPVMNDSIHMQVAWYYEDEAGNVTPAETFRERYGHVAAAVWLVGTAGFVCYGGVSYLLLKRKLRFAVKDEALPGVWYSDSIPSPCVVGLFKPQVYLTFGMSDEEKEYVLAHERQHIRNGDHLWKVLGWLVLCIHWFNIWLWAAWSVFQSTLEDACDQRTLRELGEDKKADYGQALLSLSTGKRFRPGFSPLAFGEGDTKSRVKTVLKYKKPLVWLTAVALVLAAGVGLTVLTGRVEAEDDPAADGVEGAYGAWHVSNVVHQTLFSSSTDDYLLDQWREAEIGVSSDLFSISVFENYIARSPVYQPLELGDALLTTEIGGDDPDAGNLFSLDLTKYGSVRGWRVLESTGPEETHDTGWHIFLVDGRLWLGKWRVHDNAATPYGEYWYILELVREGTPLATAEPNAGTADGLLSDEVMYWKYQPTSSVELPYFTVDCVLTSECDRIELTCENGQFQVDAHVRVRTVATEDTSWLTAFWSPVPLDGSIPAVPEDTIRVTVSQNGEIVMDAVIALRMSAQKNGIYTYEATVSLSDSTHYYFRQSEDATHGPGVSIADGPLYRWKLPDEGTHVEVTNFMVGEPKKPVDTNLSNP